ncbi:hypothetical protein D3C87_687670 [compost metagenome]
MITIYAPLKGIVAIVAADDIKAITVGEGASQFRGIASYVRLGDGSTIESSQSAETLRKLVDAEFAQQPAGIAEMLAQLTSIGATLDSIDSGIGELDNTMCRIGRNLS